MSNSGDPAAGPPTDAPGEAAGPEWTVRRLAFVLALTFGLSRRHRPDTAAAAAALGVSRRSVQRWLHGEPDARARLSPAHLEQVWQLSRPAEPSLRQEELTAARARDSIERIQLPRGRGISPVWRERRWLEQHLVGVLELPQLGLRQVATSRVAGRTNELRRRGELIDFTTVPTRFHAVVLVHELLQLLDPWRIQVPARLVKQGHTQAWTTDAPVIDLDQLAVTKGLR
jgi:hypothetical protein